MKSLPLKAFILFSLFLLPIAAKAEKYALIIGGSSKQVEPRQEFARNVAASTIGLRAKGYKVTTLFGSGRDDAEKQAYSVDYQKIGSLQLVNAFGNAKNTTTSNINATLDDLLKKVKSGDQIEILVAAHGSDSCGELGALSRNDVGSGCNYSFSVFDSDGKEVQYSGAKILEYVKKLEDKGALPNLVFQSCHSGRAKNQFQAMGLNQTCAYFQTAGNEVGYGCFESDPDFATDYTSSGEYLTLRYYKDSLSQLEADPYFSGSNCFQKILHHFKEQKMDLNSMDSAYWSSRRADQTFQSPALSSQLGISYFTTGLLQPQLEKQQSVSCEQVSMATNNLISQLGTLGKHISDSVTSRYDQALREYNQAVEFLRNELNKQLPETPERIQQIANLQKAVKDKASKVMREERALIDQMFKEEEPQSTACSRTL